MDDVLLGLKWTCCALLICVSIPNVLASSAIETYRQIFQDALPGRHLPNLTETVLGTSVFLRSAAFTLPVIRVLNVIFAKRARYWIIGSLFIVISISILAFGTWLSFFLPMNSVFTGMSDAAPK
jgi:hypothetical protein